MSSRAATTRSRRVRTSATRAAATTVVASSSQQTFGTTPPGTAVLTTTGNGQQFTGTNNAVMGTTTISNSNSQGVWAATAGLDSSNVVAGSGASTKGWASLSNSAHIGIIIGIIALLLLLGGGLAFFFIRRKRRAENASFARRTQPIRDSFVSPQIQYNGEKYNISAPQPLMDHEQNVFAPNNYPPAQRDYGAYARDDAHPIYAQFSQNKY